MMTGLEHGTGAGGSQHSPVPGSGFAANPCFCTIQKALNIPAMTHNDCHAQQSQGCSRYCSRIQQQGCRWENNGRYDRSHGYKTACKQGDSPGSEGDAGDPGQPWKENAKHGCHPFAAFKGQKEREDMAIKGCSCHQGYLRLTGRKKVQGNKNGQGALAKIGDQGHETNNLSARTQGIGCPDVAAALIAQILTGQQAGKNKAKRSAAQQVSAKEQQQETVIQCCSSNAFDNDPCFSATGIQVGR